MKLLSFNQNFLIASAIFLAAGISALVLEQLILLVIPFAILLLKDLVNIIVTKTSWLYFVLLAALPLSTEVNFTPALGLDLPDEAIMILLTGLFVVKFIQQPSIVPVSFYKNPLVLLVAIHLLWVMVVCLYSLDPMLSVKFWLAKTWFIIPFVVLPSIILTTKSSLRLAALFLLIPMGLVVLQTIIRHAFVSFSFEGIKTTLSPFFRNHVNYSAMLVCTMPIAVAMYLLSGKKSVARKVMGWLLLLFFAGVIFSYSRGAWFALVGGLLSWYFIQQKIIGRVIIAAFIIVGIVAGWLLKENYYLHLTPDYNSTVFHQNLDEHLEATVQFKDVSNAERFYRWIAGINMVVEKPLTGFGPNTFYNHYKSYTVTPFKTWVSNNPDHSTVHNYFLLTAIEQGIPGLIIFALLYFSMVLKSQQLYHQLKDNFYRYASMVVGVMLAMTGILIFTSDLIETDKVGSLFWLCLGLLVVLQRKLSSETIKTL